MSREASQARSVVPLTRSVTSARNASGLEGFCSWMSSTSNVASSDTCLPTLAKRFSTCSRMSSEMVMWRPLTSICMRPSWGWDL